ncbi:MAG TPA: hypothetical protein EYG76_02995 [Methanothermococcus okinawensis]|uniref:Uncharacterized protein n=1 Tax=Methanothermococcus okinawensis TaxID=155863 RepID=A0A832YS75_9EURY|nr:hypothetical protein [Methanothermococcus okinawensis]
MKSHNNVMKKYLDFLIISIIFMLGVIGLIYYLQGSLNVIYALVIFLGALFTLIIIRMYPKYMAKIMEKLEIFFMILVFIGMLYLGYTIYATGVFV